ncbi:MAG: glycosyltransferase family 2 protein [Yoonia sp.]|uniref:glycosyltransferase family 2 protein n=1 Tax=Yoonia sp. TaxID=2212373 RepID=UPI003EF29C61
MMSMLDSIQNTNITHINQSERKVLSLVVPVYNEATSIKPFFDDLGPIVQEIRNEMDVEIVFVNDGCSDDTAARIAAAAPEGVALSILNLSRNFGKEAALFAGLSHATGDAVVPLDVDLQDPPAVILDMISKWRGGAKVVNARRACRDKDSWMKRTSAGAFYRVFNALADHPIPTSVGDFRLLDREVVNAIASLGERSRFNKALFAWVGFETEEITFERPERSAGRSQWSGWKLWKLALDGIFSSSTLPLRIWTYFGAVIGILSLAYSAFLVSRVLFFGIDVPGYASTVVLILGFGAINLFALGIIGEYVGRIYIEVRQRPLFIVSSHEHLTTRSNCFGS